MSNSPVVSQYSVNGSTLWHDTYTTGDLFMRMSFDGRKTWSTPTKIVGVDGINGSDATVNETNVFNVLTGGGKFQGFYTDGTGKLYVNATYIKSGTITGIDVISSKFWNDTQGAYIIVGSLSGNYGDLKLLRSGGTTPVFQVYDNINDMLLKKSGTTFLRTTGSASYPKGTWNFSEVTTVSGLSTNTSGNHNHGIPNGTFLMTADGGSIEFNTSGSHSHSVNN